MFKKLYSKALSSLNARGIYYNLHVFCFCPYRLSVTHSLIIFSETTKFDKGLSNIDNLAVFYGIFENASVLKC